jgi:hypothetical protein
MTRGGGRLLPLNKLKFVNAMYTICEYRRRPSDVESEMY